MFPFAFKYKMNNIINKFLFAEDIFTYEIHLRQPGCTCSACGTFTKNKEINKKNFKKQEIRDIFMKMK